MPFTDSINMVDVIIADKILLNTTPSDVVSGKQFIGSTKHVETGTLPVNAVRSDTIIVAGESFNIPNGVNPVSYNVIARQLGDETPGTATASDILYTKTAWVNGEKITGLMNNVGEENEELLCGQSHSITRGFHNGAGVITAKNLRDQTMASVAASELLENCSCWANGEKIIGTMPNNGKVTRTLVAGETFVIPAGYHNGSGSVTASSLPSQTSGTATEREIIEGYTAWVNGQKITGVIPNNSTEDTIILPLNGTYNIPYGYHNGMSVVTQNIPSKEGQTIAPTKEAQTIPLAGYYMEGDIVVSGVDGLNYQYFDRVFVKDLLGENIDSIAIDNPTDNKWSSGIFMDNWHDNGTKNMYNLIITGAIDSNGISHGDIDTFVTIDNELSQTYTLKCGSIEVRIYIDSEDGNQVIEVSGITSGVLSLRDVMASRSF